MIPIFWWPICRASPSPPLDEPRYSLFVRRCTGNESNLMTKYKLLISLFHHVVSLKACSSARQSVAIPSLADQRVCHCEVMMNLRTTKHNRYDSTIVVKSSLLVAVECIRLLRLIPSELVTAISPRLPAAYHGGSALSCPMKCNMYRLRCFSFSTYIIHFQCLVLQ